LASGTSPRRSIRGLFPVVAGPGNSKFKPRVPRMIKQATWTDIERVAKAMKADHRSACAVTGTDDPVTAIQGLSSLPFVGVTIWKDDEPIVACGPFEPGRDRQPPLFELRLGKPS
jgi:hypothetical protein